MQVVFKVMLINQELIKVLNLVHPQSSADSNEMYFTKEEALVILKISTDTFNDYVTKGLIESETFPSGEIKYLKQDVKQLLHFILDDEIVFLNYSYLNQIISLSLNFK